MIIICFYKEMLPRYVFHLVVWGIKIFSENIKNILILKILKYSLKFFIHRFVMHVDLSYLKMKKRKKKLQRTETKKKCCAKHSGVLLVNLCINY